MKQYIKTYLIVTVCSVVFVCLPWVFSSLKLVSKLDVLDGYAELFALIAIVATIVYVIKHVKEMKFRIIIILLNPVMYYYLFLFVIRILFSIDQWHGFNLTS